MRGAGDVPLVTITRFVPEDAAGIITLWSNVFAGDPPWNEPRAMLERKLAVDDLVFVARSDDRVVGTVLGGYDGVRGWIYHLAVAPSDRRWGIATRLMHEVERALSALGCPKINLQVRATNAAVVGFYRTLGYELEERVSLGKRVARET
jgi:ribosomal protein S18 acetylase RimI-like enzyme